MKEDFALVIGINDYTPPNQFGLRTLKGAVNDANSFAEWLLTPSGGNLPVENVQKIVSSPTPLKPLQDEIDDAFLEIESAILKKGGSARRLYFYFAGHGLGTLDSTIDTGLCLANWTEKRRHSALSSELYKDYIKQYGYFEEILFIVDCCRNTKINIKPKAPNFSSITPGLNAGKTKLFMAYATQYQDQSYEVESESSELRGAFTSALIDALNGAAGTNGQLMPDDLRDYLRIETPKIAQKNGYKQIPEVSHTYPNDEPLLTFENKDSNVTLTFAETREHPIELYDGNYSLIRTFDPATDKTCSLLLKTGLYLLKETITNESLPINVLPIQNTLDVRF